ncbi:MAG: molybdopterin-dependent oxidoreductase [Coriobacteriales bacterium]|nr:molybdopterin-dependent oxidoreductase [Coriobacteriales bacterium]
MPHKRLDDLSDPAIEVRKSMCYFCHTNCGVLAYVKDGEVLAVKGDPSHPVNKGGLCSRGNIALKHLNHPDRINRPLKRAGERGENKWETISWDQALDEIAERLAEIRDTYGAEAVATAGGTLRTDDWARRRFMNLYGSPNGFHNALLCWIPTFMIEAAISGWSPFVSDMANSRIAVIWGANPGASTLPSMRGITDLQKNGLKVIVIDPRFTETAAHADLWLPIRPGADLALALAWINVIISEKLYDAAFVRDWCVGFDELAQHVAQYTPEWAEPLTWLSADLIRTSARLYATNTPGNIQWGTALDQQGRPSGAGIQARAILRAITGNIDCPGGDLMPGPSEEYVVDEELEANEYLSEEQRAKQIGASTFKLCAWPGYRLIADIAKEKWGKAPTAEWMCEANAPAVFRAILTGEPYPVRALIVSATNPVSSYGNSLEVMQALKKVDFLVTCEYWMTTAALYSDYVLPIAGALERPIIHNSYGCSSSLIASQRAIEPLHERGTDYWFWQGLGLRLGQDEDLWPWDNEEEAYYYVVYPLGFDVEDYDEFVEVVGSYFPEPQYYRYRENGFTTRSGKVELYSSVLEELGYPPLPTYVGPVENEQDHPELAKEYPLVLSAGGGFMPFHHSEEFNVRELRYLRHEPYFEINPATAAALGIREGDWCWIETRRGRIRQRAGLTNGVHERVIVTQRGWWYPERGAKGDDPFGALESNTNVLTATDEDECDPISGTWANRGLLCRVYPCKKGGRP